MQRCARECILGKITRFQTALSITELSGSKDLVKRRILILRNVDLHPFGF